MDSFSPLPPTETRILDLGRSKLALFYYGPDEGEGAKAAEWIARVVAQVASSARSPPDYLEVHIYSSEELMRALTALEELRRGVVASAEFDVFHEAWSGIPRIHIALDKLRAVDRSTAEALIAHEVVHAALHGSPEFYTVAADLSSTASVLALYIAAVALKDLEVYTEMVRTPSLRERLVTLKRYWEKALPEAACNTPEDIANLSKALALYAALGENVAEARIRDSCRSAAETLYSSLARIRDTADRPWNLLEVFAEAVAKALQEVRS